MMTLPGKLPSSSSSRPAGLSLCELGMNIVPPLSLQKSSRHINTCAYILAVHISACGWGSIIPQVQICITLSRYAPTDTHCVRNWLGQLCLCASLVVLPCKSWPSVLC